MTKRQILSVLMLVIGGLASLTLEGLIIGLPLLAIGLYWLSGTRRFSGLGKHTVHAALSIR